MSKLDYTQQVHNNPEIGQPRGGYDFGVRKADGTTRHGVIEKCPHCEATNIAKWNKKQVTCGLAGCIKKQRKHTQKLRDEAKKTKGTLFETGV
jgi:hypothetical protein